MVAFSLSVFSYCFSPSTQNLKSLPVSPQPYLSVFSYCFSFGDIKFMCCLKICHNFFQSFLIASPLPQIMHFQALTHSTGTFSLFLLLPTLLPILLIVQLFTGLFSFQSFLIASRGTERAYIEVYRFISTFSLFLLLHVLIYIINIEY